MKRPSAILGALGLFLLPACATLKGGGAPAGGEPAGARASQPAPLSPNLDEVAADSTLDISYFLGHSVHQYLVQAKADEIVGKMLVDHELLRERGLDKLKYWDLFQRVAGFVSDTTQRHPAGDAPCRSPYLVNLRVGTRTQTLSGCRTSADGAVLSKLTRDAEFLLYSRK